MIAKLEEDGEMQGHAARRPGPVKVTQRDRHAAVTEQLADFLGIELLADNLDLFIQRHGEPGG